MISSLGKIVYSTAKKSHPTAIESAFKHEFIRHTKKAAKNLDQDMFEKQEVFSSVLSPLVKGLESAAEMIQRLKGENGISEKMARKINGIFSAPNKADQIFDKFLVGKGAAELIDDGFGARIKINSKTFTNKKGEQVNTLDEIFKRILKSQKKGKLQIEEIESYHGKGFSGYINEELKNTLALEGSQVISKTKEAGYTRINMILSIDGKKMELQLGGSDMLGNKEHIFHNIREKKEINFSKYTAKEKTTAKKLVRNYKKILTNEEGKKVFESYLNDCWKYDKDCFDKGIPMELNGMPKIQDAFKNFLNNNPQLKKAYRRYLSETGQNIPTNKIVKIKEGEKTVQYDLEKLHLAKNKMNPILDVRVFANLPT